MDCGHLAVHHAVDEQQPHASAARALEELDQRLHVLEHAVPASAPPQSRRFMMALRARTQTTDVGCQHRLNVGPRCCSKLTFRCSDCTASWSWECFTVRRTASGGHFRCRKTPQKQLRPQCSASPETPRLHNRQISQTGACSLRSIGANGVEGQTVRPKLSQDLRDWRSS